MRVERVDLQSSSEGWLTLEAQPQGQKDNGGVSGAGLILWNRVFPVSLICLWLSRLWEPRFHSLCACVCVHVCARELRRGPALVLKDSALCFASESHWLAW